VATFVTQDEDYLAVETRSEARAAARRGELAGLRDVDGRPAVRIVIQEQERLEPVGELHVPLTIGVPGRQV